MLVTCGYNGSEGQNHAAIIEAIKNLPEEIKGKASFLFPMTYGATAEYLSTVYNALDKAGVHYTIIDISLSFFVILEKICIIHLWKKRKNVSKSIKLF